MGPRLLVATEGGSTSWLVSVMTINYEANCFELSEFLQSSHNPCNPQDDQQLFKHEN